MNDVESVIEWNARLATTDTSNTRREGHRETVVVLIALRDGLSEAVEQLSKQHGPFNHDLIKDEQACPRCEQLTKLRALVKP
jgi:hypothetical protein